MTTSTVPGVLDALIAAGKAVLPAAVLNVYGQPLENLPADFVAWAWNDGQSAVNLVEGTNNAGYAGGTETYDVTNQIVAWRGGAGEVHDAVAAVYSYFNLIDDAVHADPHLGDLVMFAQITASNLVIAQTTKGPIASLAFTVRIQATK